jgi:hypothetical protein
MYDNMKILGFFFKFHFKINRIIVILALIIYDYIQINIKVIIIELVWSSA